MYTGALAEEADEEYERRLREGLEKTAKMMDGDGRSSNNPLGNKDAEKAPDKAVEKGKDADPY